MPAPTQRHSNVAFFCATILDFKTNRIERCFLKTGKGGVNLWREPVSRVYSGSKKSIDFGGTLPPGKEVSRMSKEPLEAMPDVLDASQLADVLHLSRSGAYNLLNKPDFPTLHVGGKKLVLKQALIDWMRRHTNASTNGREQ